MVRLEDHSNFAIFRDVDGLYVARMILGPCTPENPWNFGEVYYAARSLEDIIKKIDDDAPEDK